MKGMLLVRGFDGWYEKLSGRLHARRTCERIILRMSNMCIAAAYERWNTGVLQLKQSKLACRKIILRIQLRTQVVPHIT